MMTFLLITAILYLVVSLGYKGLLLLIAYAHIRDGNKVTLTFHTVNVTVDIVALAFVISYFFGAFK
jgi:hypothetical protein